MRKAIYFNKRGKKQSSLKKKSEDTLSPYICIHLSISKSISRFISISTEMINMHRYRYIFPFYLPRSPFPSISVFSVFGFFLLETSFQLSWAWMWTRIYMKNINMWDYSSSVLLRKSRTSPGREYSNSLPKACSSQWLCANVYLQNPSPEVCLSGVELYPDVSFISISAEWPKDSAHGRIRQ